MPQISRASARAASRKEERMSRWFAGAMRGAITSMIVIVAAIMIWPAGALAEETGGLAGLSSSPDSGPAVHYDTSSPLSSIPPSSTPGQVYPARPGPPLPSASSQTSAPDTSGTQLASPLSPLIPSTIANFNGIGENACNCVPPDPSGAAGPSQYVEVANTDLAVYSKTGTALLGPEATNTLWSGFGGGCEKNNNGDGTVLFDTVNQRWVVQQFSVSTTPYLDCVAVSSTSDATGTWHRYSFEYSKFPDYPKMGVWPDAYYASFNLFNLSPEKFEGTEACAFNRAKMLNGEVASQQCFVGSPTGGKSLLPATLDGTTQPPSGEAEWFVALSPTTTNALAYWKFHVDWSNPANTTFTGPTNLPVEAFSQACGGGACIPQAETSNKLDSLGDRLMFRLAYRNFGGHESMVVSHAVTSGSSVGMRWYELRPSSGSLTVYQQGTYAPDSTYRWMGSIAMDKAGDMALGYSASSSTLHPQIRYTGRLVGDSLGTMPQGEATLYEGPGSQTSYARWGDYTEMSVDPSDDCTFWYVNEYLPSNGSFNWHTRIGSFKFPSCSGTPSATTEPATNVTKAGATLNGTVNPNGSETKYYFEYGLKKPTEGEKYEHQTAEASAGSGTSNVKESKVITGLTVNTQYHFRIVATNSKGTTDGADLAFTTLPNAPENTVPPVISPTTPVKGNPESTTNGTWTNNPTSYAYEWERCNATGGECKEISGATSSTYTPGDADLEHTLVVKVTAKNSGGSNAATSAPTSEVKPNITEYALPSLSQPNGITEGPDKNLWFTDLESGKIGKITTSGTITEYSLPSLPEESRPVGIAVGPDKNLWFTDYGSGKIGKITTSGAITEYSIEYPIPSAVQPSGIVAGPEKEDLWFADYGTSRIGKITTSGTITEYSLPEHSKPYGIAAGPDGNVWFADYGTSKIGKITTSGIITEYSLPSGSVPDGITAGPDGNLWFTDRETSKIGKITTSGTITEYSLLKGESKPYGITTGPDGNLWFTDFTSNSRIGKITTSGTITEYVLPTNTYPVGIVTGPDQNLWFAGLNTNKIGKITP
jgi:streptogramin lyase